MFPLPKMRMMRKYAGKATAAAMAAAMMVSMMGVTAFAAEPDTKSTDVKYEVTQSYKWSVPSEVEFTQDTKVVSDQKVEVTENIIPAGHSLQIALNEDNTFKITSNEEAVLSYTVTGKQNLNAGDAVLKVKAGVNSGEQALTFTLTKDNVEKAGTYTGTLSYTASVVGNGD